MNKMGNMNTTVNATGVSDDKSNDLGASDLTVERGAVREYIRIVCLQCYLNIITLSFYKLLHHYSTYNITSTKHYTNTGYDISNMLL
jgi:hypothetical protein